MKKSTGDIPAESSKPSISPIILAKKPNNSSISNNIPPDVGTPPLLQKIGVGDTLDPNSYNNKSTPSVSESDSVQPFRFNSHDELDDAFLHEILPVKSLERLRRLRRERREGKHKLYIIYNKKSHLPIYMIYI